MVFLEAFVMKISAKIEYACIALIDLAARQGIPEPVRIGKIAERYGLSERFLVQILLQLKEAEFVESTRGATGGYRFKKKPEDVTLLQVMNAIDPPPKNKPVSVSDASAVLYRVWEAADKPRQDKLNSVTIADLVRMADLTG